MDSSDLIIVGGGIVGLATAYQFSHRYPDKTITLLEKESTLAFHQSGRNSGVLHSGIYYKPGSLKAINCRAGKALMEAFCAEQGIPYQICGKVIVALDESELDTLQMIYERGQANGVRCELISAARLREIEPHTAGIKAIYVPEAGIVDYKQVCAQLATLLRRQGHRILLNTLVTGIVERPSEVIVETSAGVLNGRYLINCAGQYSDRVTKLAGGNPPAQIIPFRGEYYELTPAARHLCRGLIYPVPDPKFPFLGVHFTLMISGGVECGPNAVLAFAREGYQFTQVNLPEFWETLRYPGFRKLARSYWRTGMGEMWRSISKKAFVKALQRLVAEIKAAHLIPAPAGIRAQVVQPDGSMMDDFAFQESHRIVNVINAPSPAATSSLRIGQSIVDKIAYHFA